MTVHTSPTSRAQKRQRLRAKGLPWSGAMVPIHLLDLYGARAASREEARRAGEWDAVEAYDKKVDELFEKIAGCLSPEERREWAKAAVAK